MKAYRKEQGSRPSSAPAGPRAARAPRTGRGGRQDGGIGESKFSPIYDDEMPCGTRSRLSRARSTRRRHRRRCAVRNQLKDFEANGYGKFPVCMARTQYFFTTDPTRKGAPTDHMVPIREVRLSAGGVHRRHLRRHHDHAGPPAPAGRRGHRPRGRRGRRPVLGAEDDPHRIASGPGDIVRAVLLSWSFRMSRRRPPMTTLRRWRRSGVGIGPFQSAGPNMRPISRPWRSMRTLAGRPTASTFSSTVALGSAYSVSAVA